MDNFNTEYFDIPEYEIVCQECSKLFTSSDENNKVCYECWQKLVDFNGEGRGDEES